MWSLVFDFLYIVTRELLIGKQISEDIEGSFTFLLQKMA